MGLIKKKTASRGTEGGIKYVCDVCSSDITSTVSSERIPQLHALRLAPHASPGYHINASGRFAYAVPTLSAMSTTSV
jgi:hypothetical protein